MRRMLGFTPGTPGARRRMEKLLDDDVRIKNAKVRMKERGANISEQASVKKRKLDDIEDRAMREQDPGKLEKLFEEYREEYEKLVNEGMKKNSLEID